MKKEIICGGNFMLKKITVFCTFLFLIGGAHSNEKPLLIQGEKQILEISDIPLPQYQYEDISFFTKDFEPEKELLYLLNNPDLLLNVDNETKALSFDEGN